MARAKSVQSFPLAALICAARNARILVARGICWCALYDGLRGGLNGPR